MTPWEWVYYPRGFSTFCSQTPGYFLQTLQHSPSSTGHSPICSQLPHGDVLEASSLPIIQRYFHIVRYFYGNSFLPIATFFVHLGCSNKSTLKWVAYKQKFPCQCSGGDKFSSKGTSMVGTQWWPCWFVGCHFLLCQIRGQLNSLGLNPHNLNIP